VRFDPSGVLKLSSCGAKEKTQTRHYIASEGRAPVGGSQHHHSTKRDLRVQLEHPPEEDSTQAVGEEVYRSLRQAAVEGLCEGVDREEGAGVAQIFNPTPLAAQQPRGPLHREATASQAVE